MNSEAKIQELEAKVEELTALVERMTALQPAASAMVGTPAVGIVRPTEETAQRSSRRGMLKLAGAAAVGAAAAVATNALPAAAATGGNMIIGQSNVADTGDVTSLVGVSFGLADSSTAADLITGYTGTLIGWDTSNSTSGIRAGVMGYSGPFFGGGRTPHGVFGVVRATDATGAGVYARSEATGAGISPALRARSTAGAAIQLDAVLTGVPTTGTWTQGAVLPDTSGNVWVCVASGAPGTWRKLAGPSTSGSLQLLAAPKRVYDSRPGNAPDVAPKTPLSGSTRTIDCKQNSSGVPAGATGLVLNVTALSLSANGYLSVSPGASGFSGTSTLNWTSTGAVVANGVTVGAGAGATIDITIGGGGNADFIVDVMGFYA